MNLDEWVNTPESLLPDILRTDRFVVCQVGRADRERYLPSFAQTMIWPRGFKDEHRVKALWRSKGGHAALFESRGQARTYASICESRSHSHRQS